MRGMFRWWLLLSLGQLVLGSTVVTESQSSLPKSLSSVVSTLETDGVQELRTACFLSSRGVTSKARVDLFSVQDSATTAFGTDNGLCVALQPSSVAEAAASVLACGGRILYYADDDDLIRNEGLCDTLAPAIETVLREGLASQATLVVVSSKPETAREQLEATLEEIIPNLVSDSKVSELKDVFASIHFVSTIKEAMELLVSSADPISLPLSFTPNKLSATPSPSMLLTSTSGKDLAAARFLASEANKARDIALQTVKAALGQRLVPDFARLSSAATRRATQELKASAPPAMMASALGKQIMYNFQEEMSAELADLGEQQIKQLTDTCFDEFKANLSKLRISPLLASDMDKVVQGSSKDFAARARRISSRVEGHIVAFNALVHEYSKDRLLAAKASGQYHPAPPKAISIGLHWLIPNARKITNPFWAPGWITMPRNHEADNYVPPSKLTGVNPNDVLHGDWRENVLPAPSGNLMIYTPSYDDEVEL